MAVVSSTAEGASRPGAPRRRLSLLWFWGLGIPLRVHRRGVGWRERLALLLAAALALCVLPDGSRAVRAAVDLGEVVRNAPVTVGALAWGVAHGGQVSIRHGMLVITNMHGGARVDGGTTIGNVYLTGASGVSDWLLGHERRHVDQWAVLGPVGFPVAYGAAELVSRYVLHAGSSGNVFEILAGLREGGYPLPRGHAADELVRMLSPGPGVGHPAQTLRAAGLRLTPSAPVR